MFRRFIYLGATFFLFLAIFAESAFAFESVKFAIEEICGHMTGNLGGLLMTVAGIGGLASAAFGNYRASQGLIVTGIGAFAISSVLSLYFPKAAESCDGEGQANAFDGFQGDVNPGGAEGLTRNGNFAFDPNPARNNRAAALAIAAGRNADFSNAATLNQTTGEFVEEQRGEQGFDPTFNEFGEEF